MGIWSFSGKGKLMIAFGNSKWCANDECDRLERHGLGGGGWHFERVNTAAVLCLPFFPLDGQIGGSVSLLCGSSIVNTLLAANIVTRPL